MAERRISHDTLYLVFERLNRSGDLHVVLQAVQQRKDVLEKHALELLPHVDVTDPRAVRAYSILQGRVLEAKRFFNAFRHWGARKAYEGDGSEATAERVAT